MDIVQSHVKRRRGLGRALDVAARPRFACARWTLEVTR